MLTHVRGVWRYTTVVSGAQFVMITGMTMMPPSCASNWVSMQRMPLPHRRHSSDKVRPPDDSIVTPQLVGSSTSPIWLDEVACTGSEQFLSKCPSNGWAVHDCSHYEDAGVICQGAYHVTSHVTAYCVVLENSYSNPVRLVQGSSYSEGTVEVYSTTLNGWGMVCDSLWGLSDATVVCRMLGFDGMLPYLVLPFMVCV